MQCYHLVWRNLGEQGFINVAIWQKCDFSTRMGRPGHCELGRRRRPEHKELGSRCVCPGKESLGRVGLDSESLGRRTFQLAEAAAQARRAWVVVGLDTQSLGRPVLQPAGWSGLGKKSRGQRSGTCRCQTERGGRVEGGGGWVSSNLAAASRAAGTRQQEHADSSNLTAAARRITICSPSIR